MFSNCTSFEELNLSNFSTNNLNNVEYMFSGCTSLKILNIPNFTKKEIYMCDLFENCKSLKEINLSNINIKNLHSIYYMFKGSSYEIQRKAMAQIQNESYEENKNKCKIM